ncbi:MAG: hypothetical protein HXS44_12925 [Theionarchaea archaeon]|nr:hypothetical protein [Theionarchaea archaeon]
MIKIDKKAMSFVIVFVVVTFLAITCVTARSLASNTPLYTLRMEQASSKMNFLPTTVNKFAFTAEKGYELTCNIDGNSRDLHGIDTPSFDETECYPCPTYVLTCPDTCDTCLDTCPDTCEGPTCPVPTCDDETCYYTGCGEKTCRPEC